MRSLWIWPPERVMVRVVVPVPLSPEKVTVTTGEDVLIDAETPWLSIAAVIVSPLSRIPARDTVRSRVSPSSRSSS